MVVGLRRPRQAPAARQPVLAAPLPGCVGRLRPDVVLFGEALPLDQLAPLEEEMARGFDLIFTIGTTGVSPHIAGPVEWAAREGTPTVEVNPVTSRVSHRVRVWLALGASRALHAIWRRFRQRH